MFKSTTSLLRTRTTTPLIASRTLPQATSTYPLLRPRTFHSTTAVMVKEGDSIPDVELTEGSPGNKVNLSKVLTGKGVIIGVPAAFSPGCTETHVPGWINSEKAKSAGDIYVVAVNDAFVMKAWGKALDPNNGGIRFLADATGAFTKALGLDWDATAALGNHRSKRYALVVEDGKVKSAHVEPDNTGIDVSTVDKVLG